MPTDNSSRGNPSHNNLELLTIPCPRCGEHSPANLWVIIMISTTMMSASFSFGGKPRDAESLTCPKCKQSCSYQEILDVLKKG